MISYFFNALSFFRPVFSRNSPWLLFCMVIIGFIGANEMIGVTSFCRFQGLGANGYNTLLHFFRSGAWSAAMIIIQWQTFVVAQQAAVMAEDRVVLAGDHTYVPKDGRHMPGVVTLHQNSETQSKPSYFRGHQWGAICLMIGTFTAAFGLPLSLGIHQGQKHITDETDEEKDCGNLKTRIIQMAIDFAVRHNLPCVLTLDAYFPGASVFILANSFWSIELKQPLVTLIIRAKKNCVGYYEAKTPQGKKGRGRPKKYGEKVKLTDLFELPHFFSTAQCLVYGKMEDITFLAVNLLWKPTGETVRFVLAVTSRGPIVLMCSDLCQDSLLAIRLYCMRIRVEIMFDMLKNLLGAFRYRFWSKCMPRHSRKPEKNKDLIIPSSEDIKTVKLCWDAYERFTMLAAIALGLLQLIALKYPQAVWNRFDVYLRTRSRELPSERTVKFVMTRLLVSNLFIVAPVAIIREIKERYFRGTFSHHQSDPSNLFN